MNQSMNQRIHEFVVFAVDICAEDSHRNSHAMAWFLIGACFPERRKVEELFHCSYTYKNT